MRDCIKPTYSLVGSEFFSAVWVFFNLPAAAERESSATLGGMFEIFIVSPSLKRYNSQARIRKNIPQGAPAYSVLIKVKNTGADLEKLG
jgi:hypothetical protein